MSIIETILGTIIFAICINPTNIAIYLPLLLISFLVMTKAAD